MITQGLIQPVVIFWIMRMRLISQMGIHSSIASP